MTTRSRPAPITATTRCDAPVAVITSSPGLAAARAREGTSTCEGSLITLADLDMAAIGCDYEAACGSDGDPFRNQGHNEEKASSEGATNSDGITAMQ